jgi:regulator of RNase E activity RraA
MPLQLEDLTGDWDAADAFGVMFRALDELKPGEVYLTAGGSLNYALWGGLMSTRAQKLGAAGAVFDGFHRDTREIIRLGFPVFSRGAYAQDQRGRGRVTDFRCPVTFANGTRAEPGDILVGDIDGVAVVPKAHAVEIVRLALQKVEGEDGVRRMIESGETTESVFAKTGIM